MSDVEDRAESAPVQLPTNSAAGNPQPVPPQPDGPQRGAIRGFVDRYLLTILAATGVALVFLFVPQVRNLVSQLPAGFTTGIDWHVYVLFTLYISALVVLYIVLLCALIPGDWLATRKDVLWSYVIRKSDDARELRRSEGRQRPLALFLCAFGLAGIVSGFVEWGSDARFGFDPPYRKSVGLLLAWLGAVLAFRSKLGDKTYRLQRNVLGALVLLNVLGEVIWIGAEHCPLMSNRNYSIWALLHIAFCVLIVARAVDFWHSYSPLPIRQIFVVLVVIGFAGMRPVQVGREVAETAPQAPPQEGHSRSWLRYLRCRINSMPDDGPVIMVAASGGGSRAAVFTALVLEHLRTLEFDRCFAAETYRKVSTDDRKPTQPGLADPKYTAGDHIALISAVSGGSLASAVYLHSLQPPEPINTATRSKTGPGLRNSIAVDVLERMPEAINSIVAAAEKEAPSTNAGAFDYLVAACTVRDDIASGCDEYRKDGHIPHSFRWLFNRHVDDMCTDFMAPLLRGALYWGSERGQAVTTLWETRFKLNDLGELITDLNTDTRVTVPALLCNACDIAAGTPLVIGYPQFPADLFRANDESKRAKRPLTLEERTRRQGRTTRVTLSEAVRLAANFPWGFAVAQVGSAGGDPVDRNRNSEVNEQGQRQQKRGASQTDEGNDRAYVIDGGVFDNTGMETLRCVIDAIAELASQYEKRKRAPVADRKQANANALDEEDADWILKELRRRGVIVIEIDSGAKPQPPGLLARTLSALFMPLKAMENAGYASGDLNLTRNMAAIGARLPLLVDRSTQTVVSDAGAKDEMKNVWHVVFQCNHEENVMTAWALGPEDKAKIFARFLVESEVNRKLIATALGGITYRAAKLQEIAAEGETDNEKAKKAIQELVGREKSAWMNLNRVTEFRREVSRGVKSSPEVQQIDHPQPDR